ncbi:PrgI family protein [Actinoalloteichus caeruleus]|uniref:PrgI family protein n=1 Tax=Actinoalloteichus cyanogriseus TaxID=2893586 RepID=UPI003AAF66DE
MTAPVRIPADVDMHDRVLGPLTARQLAILAAAAGALYLAWWATRSFLPLPVFLAVALPLGALAGVVALGKRDGIPMDMLLVAAIRQRLAPRRRVAAPEGVRQAPAWLTSAADGSRDYRTRPEQVSPSPLQLPAEAVTETGVIDLGADGVAVVAVASTVNFALRTPTEQEALTATFGRYLHSLTAPVQVLVRTERLDLSGQIAELRAQAGGLPHPALESAAVEHADYLVRLGQQTDLLRRQVLLILREQLAGPGPTDGLGGPGLWAKLGALTTGRRAHIGEPTAAARRAAESRLVRRLTEAVELLSPAGITVSPLDAGQATAVLASACNPDTLLPPSAATAGADEVITTAAAPDLTDDRYDRPFDVPSAASPVGRGGTPRDGDVNEPGRHESSSGEGWPSETEDWMNEDWTDNPEGRHR